MPWLAILPALLGAGGAIGSSLLNRRGGGSTSPALDQQAGLQTKALEQLLAELSRLRGNSGALQGEQQQLIDSLGTVFDFSGLPGLDPEQSAWLSQMLGPLAGKSSVRPAQEAFGREAALAQLLLGASGGNAAGQQANLSSINQSQLANSLGGAAGGISQMLGQRSFLQQILELLQQQSSGGPSEQIMSGFPATPWNPWQ
jgi:hypothetical protein